MDTLDKAQVLEGVTRQRARTIEFVRSLTPEQWETEVLPRWRVREVVGHLISTDEAALTGRMFGVLFRRSNDGGLARIEAWNDAQAARWADRPIDELVAGLERWGRRGVKAFKPVPQALLRKRISMGLGRVPLLYLGVIRMFDEYVHEIDMRRALGRTGQDRDPAALRRAARAMLDVAAQQTPVGIPAGAAGRVAVVFSDPGLPSAIVDLSSKAFTVGGEPEGADAKVVVADAEAFIMAAARRDAWRDAERAGALSIEGDRTAAEAFLDALRAA